MSGGTDVPPLLPLTPSPFVPSDIYDRVPTRLFCIFGAVTLQNGRFNQNLCTEPTETGYNKLIQRFACGKDG